MFKFKKNNKKGFSLIELIVVIAIMAVIAVVLVPALLSYVEESRAGKDMKTTDELVNSVELALTDQDVYDELLEHTIEDNISCYVDRINEAECTSKTVVKAANDSFSEWYEFSDDDRQADETPYYGAGNMRGITITFSPVKSSNESEYVLKDGIINKFVGRKTGYLHENERLYNAIRSIMGDVMSNSSQTYRNSDFTVFIRMGTTGGNEASQQDAVKVYGQFNGTNLPNDDTEICKITSNRTVGNAGANDGYVNELINSKDISLLNFNESGLMGSGTVSSSGTSVYDLMKKDASEAYINELKTNNEMSYYSTLSLAIADANNNTVGTNADADENTATASIYMSDGKIYVVLLKNTTETSTITISNNIVFDLAGNALSFNNLKIGLNATSGNVIIDGKLSGSAVDIKCTGDLWAIAIQTTTSMTINGGNNLTINAEAENGVARAINSAGNLTINDCKLSAHSKNSSAQNIFNYTLTVVAKNCKITALSDNDHSYCIYQSVGATITASNCNMESIANVTRAVGIGQSNESKATLIDCNINTSSTEGTSRGVLQFTDASNQTATITNCNVKSTGKDGCCIMGAPEAASLIVNDSYAVGGRGLIAYGKAEVNGGTYIGNTGNAVSFCQENGVYYIQDATIESPNTEDGLNAFTGNGITVYVNNCDISSLKHPIWIGAVDNVTFYVSNSRINLDCENGIRLRSNTNKLYIGVGCNFTIDNVYDFKECVTVTNDTYVKSE